MARLLLCFDWAVHAIPTGHANHRKRETDNRQPIVDVFQRLVDCHSFEEANSFTWRRILSPTSLG